MTARGVCDHWQPKQQCEECDQQHDRQPDRDANTHACWLLGTRRLARQDADAGNRAQQDRRNLPAGRRQRQTHKTGRDGDAGTNRSGARLRAMPQTACATTATATSFSPRSHPAWDRSPIAPTPRANSVIASADGRVKPAQAASMPSGPPRIRPIAMPVCDDAGPGMNWHRPTMSANVASVSQQRRATSSARK